MSSIIQPSYGAKTYNPPTKSHKAAQSGAKAGSFMDMAIQTSQNRAAAFTAGLSGNTGMSGMPSSLMADLAVRSGRQVLSGGTEAVGEIGRAHV